ncbi:serine/threonine protein kinase [Hassallia byssoidea VB512170]|uniref:Serine/threonine protein kinase n=1 Tax=Hassallia byssoidea VB512170 TaxID=1304833 RepID=A0A846HHC9_9CYAN|nr:serine/threonine-protein kinase [Hassalia byssoidea]NEU76473.1 serine/threonine protein kinase [Hassalia byssoidea VB512170]
MAIDIAWLQTQFPEISSLAPLNQGGQKEVFSGVHITDRTVVLKIYRPQTDIDRVIREIQAVQDIGSSRVPKVFDLGTRHSPIGDFLWVREEMVTGNNLRQILQAKGTLTPQQILRLGKQMLEALADAEKTRIVHRDVKPENIIIDNNSDAWLLDFGLVRHLDLVSLTATSDPYGAFTPGYAPPEQFRNRKCEIDARTDLFALGVTLYECLEGINPFIENASNLIEVLHRVETTSFPTISKPVDKRGQFSQLIWAMTRQRPDHRLSTITEALTWIEEICTEEGVS